MLHSEVSALPQSRRLRMVASSENTVHAKSDVQGTQADLVRGTSHAHKLATQLQCFRCDIVPGLDGGEDCHCISATGSHLADLVDEVGIRSAVKGVFDSCLLGFGQGLVIDVDRDDF